MKDLIRKGDFFQKNRRGKNEIMNYISGFGNFELYLTTILWVYIKSSILITADEFFRQTVIKNFHFL